MDTMLAEYLALRTPNAIETAQWRGGQIHLDVAAYCGAEPAPEAFVTSARALLIAGNAIAVLTNPGGDHILPGGRRDPGESLEDTLQREVFEETGIRIAAPRFLGVVHYHHTTPRPPIYPYPYPDFLNAIYVVEVDAGATLTVADTYELAGRFHPIEDVRNLSLTPCQLAFLDHVLAAA